MLEIVNIAKKYGNSQVLDGLSFTLNYGQVAALIGANGSGKSTLFKIIAGLVKADAGTVLYQKRPIRRFDLGYLSERRSLYLDCRSIDQLELTARLNGFDRKRAHEEAKSWLQKMSVSSLAEKQIGSLSKGNQQKIALINTLIKNPRIVILDEPFTALDEENTGIFTSLIRKLKENQCVVLLSSHISEPVKAVADRFLILKQGKIAADLDSQQMKDVGNRFVDVESRTNMAELQGSVSQKIRPDHVTYHFDDRDKLNRAIELLLEENGDFTVRHQSAEDLL